MLKRLVLEVVLYLIYKMKRRTLTSLLWALAVFVIALIISLLISCSARVKVPAATDNHKDTIYQNRLDSIFNDITKYKDSVNTANEINTKKYDSLASVNATLVKELKQVTFTKDSLNEVNAVNSYKLLRIREYNRIAGQRNNIKYLRGWINRVLAN